MTEGEPPAADEVADGTPEPAAAVSPFEEEPAGPRPVDYEPPWREARRRVATAWAQGGTPTRIVVGIAIVIAAGLLGAFLFGLWHIVVGGFIKGNWNAAGFGFALSSVTGILLWIEASAARRLLPAAGGSGPGARA
jgi:hypothetical protein